MRQFVILVGFMLLFSGAAMAQDTPKAEVFGGYSYVNVHGFSVPGGWHGSLAGNVNRWFGIVGEISGHYESRGAANANAHVFTVGPRFSARGEKLTPFAHVTFGGARFGASLANSSASASGFAITVGFGLDIKAGDHIAIRVPQFDYITTNIANDRQHSARISLGIVFRLGSK